MPALPLFPLATIAVPGGVLPLVIFEPRYRALLADVLALPETERIFGLVAIRRGHEVGAGRAEQLYDVGTAVRVLSVHPIPAGIRVGCVGVQRFRLDARVPGADYLVGEVTWLDEEPGDVDALPGLVVQLREAWLTYADSVGAPALLDPPAPVAGGVDGDRARALAYAVLDQLRLPLAERQHVLEAVTTSERLQELVARVRREVGLAAALQARPLAPPSVGPSLN